MVHILHTVGSLASISGGPARTVTGLTDYLSRLPNASISLLSVQAGTGVVVQALQTSLVERHLVRGANGLGGVLAGGFARALRQLARCRRPDVIHDHGIWLPENIQSCRLAIRSGIPLVIHPRGMLEPWSLGQKWLKKRVAMTLYQRRLLEGAAALVATSVAEFENVRRLGLKQPIAVIPNGVELGAFAEAMRREDSVLRIRTVLFLSRVHPKKGLLNLVSAWSALRPTGWRLCIAGPDEGGHLAEVLSAVRTAGIEHYVDYVGEVDGDAKSELYRSANLFVLPSYSENFGVVVAEALAHGLPVITTRGAPWGELGPYGCGWWVDFGVEPLVEALRAAMSLTDAERAAMGLRGREYVRRFNWEEIAETTFGLYEWVLGRSAKPDCVHLY